MARVLCFWISAMCTAVLMATLSSAQNCFMAAPCLAATYSASRCGERAVACNNSHGCISTSATASAVGITRTAWSKGCVDATGCPTTPTCFTLTVSGVRTRSCFVCCRGNLCNTGSPPSSSNIAFPFSPLVISLLIVVFMMT